MVHAPAALVLTGIGLGLSSAPVQTTAASIAQHGETGQAAGLFSTMRYLGSILGSAGMAAILSGSRPSVGEFRLLYLALLVAALLAVLATSRLPARSGQAIMPVTIDRLAPASASQAEDSPRA
ncbi:MAG: hypothetical protein M9890_13595 [Thermomicrobiales bacterium]|nr:hypothetical protein [Thermomicrobiales bacterium]